MSKGPGHVERKLEELFKKNPKRPFSTRMLCLHVYPDEKIEKKHRVSVLRALKRLSRNLRPHLWRAVVVKKGQRDDMWFDYPAWPHANKLPQTVSAARDKRPRKKRRVFFQGQIFENPRKR
jgi:hypothetical protein